MNKTKFWAQAAIIAALYAVVTLAVAPFAYGPVQFRISEAMALLPLITPAAIPGLFVGCIIANLYTATVYDIIFGSLATLAAAYLTYKLKNKFAAALPPVILNGIVVGLLLTYVYKFESPLWFVPLPWSHMITVAVGEAAVCFILGIPLVTILKKYYIK